MTFILTILGVLLVIEGIPYFAFPDKVKEWSAMMQEVPGPTLRIIGLATMVFGLLLLAAIRYL